MQEREAEPRPKRPLRRGIALLPSLLTVANLGAGWYSIQESVLALQSSAAPRLDNAALAIGWAILLDGFDGRVARMANATSAFGREFDSLADVISFGVAPALLAYVWGIRFLDVTPHALRHLDKAAQIVVFLFVCAGAARLARFNISIHDAKPSNPGRPGKRYFVGMPIPAAAGVIAAIVHFFTSANFPSIAETNASWIAALVWLGLILVLAYFMVSTWRFYSFKEIDLGRRHPWVITLVVAALIAGIWTFSEVLLLIVALTYMGSAIVWRLSHHLRRRTT
jgi:CDP-diacylglycerol--serine O-phosphatidyltransferase